MSLEQVLRKYPQKEDRLIEVLLELQAEKDRNNVTEEEILQIAKHLNVTEARVCSVVSFYSFFSVRPRGKHIIRICKDVPCHVTDECDVLKTIEDILGVKAGETTANQKFTVEATSCLGCCDKSPAMRIDGDLHTELTADKIRTILAGYRG